MKLQIKPEEYGIEEKKATDLTKGLSPILKEREALIIAFDDVSELEVNEENIPTFKELRLKIVKNRTQGINKWHKASKEFFLAGGRFVDAIKNKENQVNEEMESKLMDAEKHFENLEKERVEKLNQYRIKLIEPYVDDVFGLDLGNMQDDVFEAYFESKKKQHAEKIEAEKKAEAERLEQERLDTIEQNRKYEISPYMQFVGDTRVDSELRGMSDKDFESLLSNLKKAKLDHDNEQEKIRKENERLKKEREAAEAKRLLEEKKRKEEEAKKEAEYQAKLKKEREAREKLERESEAVKAREKAEADRKAKEEEEKRKEAEKLAKAPIKEKLSLWVNSFELPETSVNNEVSKEIQAKFQAFKNWSINQINNL